MDYKAQILQGRSNYVVETLYKVWSPNSTWFSRYPLWRTFGGVRHFGTQNHQKMKKMDMAVTQNLGGLQSSYFAHGLRTSKAYFAPNLRSQKHLLGPFYMFTRDKKSLGFLRRRLEASDPLPRYSPSSYWKKNQIHMKICGGDLYTIPSTYISFAASCRAWKAALLADKGENVVILFENPWIVLKNHKKHC